MKIEIDEKDKQEIIQKLIEELSFRESFDAVLREKEIAKLKAKKGEKAK